MGRWSPSRCPGGPVDRSARLGGGVDRTVERAFASRAPFHDGVLELPSDSAIGGSWKIGGIPAFDRANGRFAGYRGVAERLDRTGASSCDGQADPDALRELAHEIKTPLNAIIGFAEIITGEYLGPAGTAYRERASEIVAQARLLLNAIEDLDFSAKLRSTKGASSAQTNLGELVDCVVASLRESASERGVRIDAPTVAGITAAIQPEVAERLILRMCDAVIARGENGEHLRMTLDGDSAHCLVSITRPNALHGLPEEELFGTADDAMSPAFPLRLARGLAQTAGTTLIASKDRISLVFPRA